MSCAKAPRALGSKEYLSVSAQNIDCWDKISYLSRDLYQKLMNTN